MPKENDNQIPDHGEVLATWDFQEFIKHKRTTTWYITAAIILGALVIFSLATANYLFFILIVLFVLIYFFRARREPANLTVRITEDGLAIGQKTFYKWDEIKSFWIIYEPPEVKNLYLDFKGGLRPSVSISMENQNPLRIRNILAEHLEEDLEKEDESFSDGIGRVLKL